MATLQRAATSGGMNVAAPLQSTQDTEPTISILNATTAAVGVVKPDGITITVAMDGTISAVGGGGTVTAVTGVAPIASSGGTTPAISIANATTGAVGAVRPDGTTVTIAGGVISVPTATTSVLGLVKPDGVTITVAAGVISAVSGGGTVTAVTGVAPIASSGGTTPAISIANATTGAPGAVQPDGSTVTISGAVISVPTATTSVLGLVKPDGVTITVAAGVISAVSGGGTVTAVTGVAPIASSGGTTPAISIANATTGAPGAVQPDGSTVTISGAVISVPTATTSVLGLVKPDGVTITVAAGVISAVSGGGTVTAVTGVAPIASSGGTTPAISIANATTGAPGAVQPDGSTVTISGAVISVPTATTSVLGLVKPDGVTITVAAGVISAVSGGLVLLEEHTASSSAELDFTSWFSSAYDDYTIEIINLVPATNSVSLLLQFSTNGGSTYDSAANYNYARYYSSSTTTDAGNSHSTTENGLAFWDGDLSNSPAGSVTVSCKLFGPGNTAVYKMATWTTYGVNAAANYYFQLFGGHWRNTAAANAFRIITSSGNIASGIVRIYGFNK